MLYVPHLSSTAFQTIRIPDTNPIDIQLFYETLPGKFVRIQTNLINLNSPVFKFVVDLFHLLNIADSVFAVQDSKIEQYIFPFQRTKGNGVPLCIRKMDFRLLLINCFIFMF